MSVEIVVADYLNPRHAADIVMLLDDYARDAMGGGEPLADSVRENLVAELSRLPYAFSLLCYVDGEPAGLANCFEGFSTFACKPLVNIHDMAVRAKFRGRGLSQRMLDSLEDLAREKGYCKITLEVLEGNRVAQNAYLKSGFAPYQLDAGAGNAQFWQKKIGRED